MMIFGTAFYRWLQDLICALAAMAIAILAVVGAAYMFLLSFPRIYAAHDSVLLFGSVLGFVGAIVGVPIMAKWINDRLKQLLRHIFRVAQPRN